MTGFDIFLAGFDPVITNRKCLKCLKSVQIVQIVETVPIVQVVEIVKIVHHRGQKSEIRDQLYT